MFADAARGGNVIAGPKVNRVTANLRTMATRAALNERNACIVVIAAVIDPCCAGAGRRRTRKRRGQYHGTKDSSEQDSHRLPPLREPRKRTPD